VFLYGILETLNGNNWVRLYLSVERGVSAEGASLALVAFWAMVTVGRVLIAIISRAVPARWIYLALPVLLLIVFQVSSRVQNETEGTVVFGLPGPCMLGISATQHQLRRR
jgi:fucose permease